MDSGHSASGMLSAASRSGVVYLFRSARLADAAEACSVIRRSIEELCVIDHDRDPAILNLWLANKTPERVRSWIDDNPTGTTVGVGDDGIAGVGCIMSDDMIELLHVAPSAVGRGVECGLRLQVRLPHAADDRLIVDDERLPDTACFRP